VLTKSKSWRVLYADHVESSGIILFKRICAFDLEGIVGLQRSASTYASVRKPSYFNSKSQSGSSKGSATRRRGIGANRDSGTATSTV